jgi:hypothetical protein
MGCLHDNLLPGSVYSPVLACPALARRFLDYGKHEELDALAVLD